MEIDKLDSINPPITIDDKVHKYLESLPWADAEGTMVSPMGSPKSNDYLLEHYGKKIKIIKIINNK